MPVFRLDDKSTSFPDPRYAEEDGLLAVGGDLSVRRLLTAYVNGIFPWYDKGMPILWWCPHERYIIRPESIHISHSMKKFIRRHDIKIAFNRNFADTIHRCRVKREFAEGTWITDDMEKAYTKLHKKGFAVSVESYIDGRLAGGLYGVDIAHCFFGESMFTDIENGSKAALIGLAQDLAAKGYRFIDCQFHTDHLESMGGEYVDYDEYKKMIRQGIDMKGARNGLEQDK
ncbi:MAG: leucyl/phenylalanyl-tRNA--protein transferase [Oscillospiraceae bacterium]|nr:leucyl/phenylalanyl-tRNA--protein transferase [Oscillospiraceae bacterium]